MDRYGWDNEFGETSVELDPFIIDSHPVTNQDYLEFVRSGAYRDSRLWDLNTSAPWFETFRPEHPFTWIAQPDGSYHYRTVFKEVPLPPHWPVEVNFFEAQAFATWSGARLLTEAEYNYLFQQNYPHFDPQSQEGFNTHARFFSPNTVGTTHNAQGLNGIELYGNVARWTSTPFAPLDKSTFRAHPLYPDFSQEWFSGYHHGYDREDHHVIKGAAYCTRGHQADPQMRDFMQCIMDQPAGIQLVYSH